MDELSIGFFIIPITSLIVVVVSYFLFAKVVKKKQGFKHLVFTIAVVAFLMNFIWEMIQGVFYEGFKYDLKHVSFCLLASITDMLTSLILYFGFAFMYKKNVYWIRDMNATKVIVLMIAGVFPTIIIEMWHIIRGDWSYAEEMLLLPFVDIGILPVLQFAFLPWIIFFISSILIKKTIN